MDDTPTWTAAPGRALILRTCSPDMTSHGGFVWPRDGEVAAPDWESTAECGNGLHGLLWGAGDGTLVSTDPDAVWVVAEVDASDVVELVGKVKVPRAFVVFAGARDVAVALVQAHAPAGTAVVWGTATAGYGGTATAGYGGTATAGHGGTATAGDMGTATAGYGGTATAGYGGIATAGDMGTATAGYGGTATAGYGGLIAITYYDNASDSYRRAFGEVAENGIQPGVAYIVRDGQLVARPDTATATAPAPAPAPGNPCT